MVVAVLLPSQDLDGLFDVASMRAALEQRQASLEAEVKQVGPPTGGGGGGG